MKKLITSFMVLFFLIGFGTKSYGQAAGDLVFSQPVATDSLWIDLSNWSVSDGVGNLSPATRLPLSTDNVFILAGKKAAVLSTIVQNATFATASTTVTLTGTLPILAPGMTVSGTGIASGSTIVSVNGTTLTLSAATTAAATTATALTFAIPTSINTITTTGSTTATLAAANASVVPGMLVTGTGIVTGTTVQSISGTTLTLSQAATATSSVTTLTFAQNPTCKSLNVSGLFRTSVIFVVANNVTVNTGGIMTIGTDFYCTNITNSGTINSITGYRSAKSLWIGFVNKVPGTGDYSIINDGTFGDTAPKVPQGNTSGIKVLYSNQANSFTVKTSTPSISGYAFNIASMLPHSNIKTTANTHLNIKESMSLLIHNSIGLSIQNNDTCPGTTRICTIDPGVTVYVGYNFHANRNVTTNDQGNFIYNVYGTLDLGTYATSSNSLTASAANTTDFGLCMTTVAGNAGSLTFNLGDGTQANAGTLILGSNIKLIKQRTQSIAVNFKDYSTVFVTGNYGWTMNYQLLNSNVPALYLFPKNFYNLTFNGTKSIIPVIPVIKGAKTYTSGAYGTTSWQAAVAGVTTVATSLYNSSSASLLPQGSIVYTGAGYYYVPIVRATSTYLTSNPITLVGDTILNFIQPAQGVAGNNLAATVTSLAGNTLTLSTPPTATATQTNVFVQFYGLQGLTAPTGTSTNAFSPVFDGTQGLIYLGGSEFANVSLTAVNSPNVSNILIYSSERNKLVISNANEGDVANVYSISGMKVATAKLTSDINTLNISTGIYLVKINAYVSKVVVK